MVYGVVHCLFMKLQICIMSFSREKRHLSVKIWTKIFYCIFHFPMFYTTYIPSFTAKRSTEQMLRVFKQGNFNYNHPVHFWKNVTLGIAIQTGLQLVLNKADRDSAQNCSFFMHCAGCAYSALIVFCLFDLSVQRWPTNLENAKGF